MTKLFLQDEMRIKIVEQFSKSNHTTLLQVESEIQSLELPKKPSWHIEHIWDT